MKVKFIYANTLAAINQHKTSGSIYFCAEDKKIYFVDENDNLSEYGGGSASTCNCDIAQINNMKDRLDAILAGAEGSMDTFREVWEALNGENNSINIRLGNLERSISAINTNMASLEWTWEDWPNDSGN